MSPMPVETAVIGAIVMAGAYLVGTVPFGVLFAVWAGAPDPRTRGSGNIGSTNVWRVAGTRAAALTLAADAAKGAAAVLLTRLIIPDSDLWAQAAGIAAVVGHVFPVWFGFHGGKGVATGLGAVVALSPLTGVVLGAVWGGVLWVTRYVSISSIAAAAVLPLAVWGLGQTSARLFAAVVAPVIILRHWENLVRVWRGTESKLGTRAT